MSLRLRFKRVILLSVLGEGDEEEGGAVAQDTDSERASTGAMVDLEEDASAAEDDAAVACIKDCVRLTGTSFALSAPPPPPTATSSTSAKGRNTPIVNFCTIEGALLQPSA